ncbi:MAG: class I SAM-dependent methyltransferase [Candidatus Bathyarchaeia archaeon]|jgi:ubiquinone/menaquinone biosynthesis C-methylase UbiE
MGKPIPDYFDKSLIKSEQKGFYEQQKTSPMWQQLFKFISSYCARFKKVLAVGCGAYELIAVKNREETIGLDLSKGSLKWLNQNGFKGQLIQASSLNLPFKNDCFDAVYSNQVIEHMLNIEGVKKFISEVERMSKNVMIITPNSAYNRKIHDPTHFFYFTTRNFKPFTKGYKIYSTNHPYSKTLAYYFLYESPKLQRLPLIGKYVVQWFKNVDSSKTLINLNKWLWPGDQLVAIKN